MSKADVLPTIVPAIFVTPADTMLESVRLDVELKVNHMSPSRKSMLLMHVNQVVLMMIMFFMCITLRVLV